jgi:serine/threonine protein kinase
MSLPAELLDDLRAVRRGEKPFDSVALKISSHLTSWPDSAEEVLRQVQNALDQQIIEPDQFDVLKTAIVDSISPSKEIVDPVRSSPLSARRLAESTPTPSQRQTGHTVIRRSNLALGTRLRDRFILDEVLGSGGMGTVYKGRDLLKVEARDRNPYIAIKVLNDDFKVRTDAFIVLQREASRQQRLAHPNIVTVFDFDRTGDIIFISMELVEGTPLDIYMKGDGQSGRSVAIPEAMRLIEGMGAALTYAHEHGIVHADFKPSNCFVMHDGRIKVLDFGIARAIRRPDEQDGDVTVYDGAKLGAMTPAYASPEMLDNSAPADPRDDIYGLACVCYELLAGHHPFARLSAREAKAHEIVPKRIKGLSTRQNRALVRALTFEREQRTPTVREFIAELRGQQKSSFRWTRKSAGIAAAIAVVIALAAAWFVFKYPATHAIADLKSGDRQKVEMALQRVETFSPDDRAQVLAAARPAVIEHFRGQVQSLAATDAYLAAESVLNRGLSMYPKAHELTALDEEVARRKDRYLSELAEEYERHLAAGRLRSERGGDIQTVMERIRRVAPQHPLLSDPRVAGAFADVAERDINAGELARARLYVEDGTRLAPNNGLLRDVTDKLARAEQEARNVSRSRELASSIEARVGSLESLDALLPVANDLVTLHEISPNNALLGRLSSRVRSLLGRNYETISNNKTVADAAAFEQRYASVFDALGLSDATSRMRARSEQLVARRDELLGELRTLAAAPGTRTRSGATIDRVIAELRTLAPSDPNVDEILTAAVAEQRRASQLLSAEGKWKEARATLTAALVLGVGPDLRSEIDAEMARIDQRERDAASASLVAEQKAAQEAARAAERQRIAAAESDLRTTLNAFSATTAGLKTFSAKVAALSALDPGNALIDSSRATAAQRIAEAANETAKAGRYDEAYALLARAAVDLPGVAAITTARSQVEALQNTAEKEQQARAVAEARNTFQSALQNAQPTDARWQREAESSLATLRKVAGEEAAVTGRGQLAAVYLNAASQYVRDERFNAAAQMLDKAQQLTPGSAAVLAGRQQWTAASDRLKVERAAQELAAKVEATKQRFISEVKANQFDRARKTLSDLRAIANANDPFVTREADAMLAAAVLASAQAKLKAGDIAGAWQVARGPGAPTDDPRFQQILAEIDTAASRRVEGILGSQSAIDGAALSALAGQYRSAAPDRYKALNPAWTATITRRLTGLASDPAAHNAYLAAVQGAFSDLPAVRSLRPIEVKPPAPVPAPPPNVAAGNTSPPVSNTAPRPTEPTTTVSTPQTTAPPAATAATAGTEPNLIGKWCGEGVGMTFAPTNYSFEIGGRRTVQYTVDRYQSNGNVITMSWSDKNLGSMVTEFGEFSADGQTMVQLRGKTAASPDWSTYNRRFKRCN